MDAKQKDILRRFMVRNKHPENWVNSQGQGQGHDDITLKKLKK